MFELSDEQRLIQQTAREFAKREIWPEAARCDREKCFPPEIAAKARELGLFNITIPEEYGGPGLGALDLTLITEQLAWGCVGLGGGISLNNLPADVLLVCGNEEQKRRYLRRLAENEYGAYAVTEPGAGSDVAALTTRALKQDDGYLLNGSKVWISNAPLASFFTVLAKTDPTAGHRGLSFFLVERDTPGLEVGNPLPKLGQNAVPAAEVFFNDVKIPHSALLGDEGEGFKIAMQVFDRSRPMVAAFAVGLMQRCQDVALDYARERKTMGQAIINHQAIGHKLAEIEMRLQAARLMTRQSAWLLDAGRSNTLQASCAKAFAADAAMWVATETLQIFGGFGYSPEFPAEKLFRDAKVLQIYEGTSEIQRNIIARELAGH